MLRFDPQHGNCYSTQSLKRDLKFCSVFFLILLCGLPGRADLPTEITAVVDAEMSSRQVAGAVVGVWRGGVPLVLLERGFSDISDNTPISASDHFRIASITKTFTTTRVMQLAQEGRLALTDPIGNYVSGLVNSSATLRQLGDMTAGFFSYTQDPVFLSELVNNPQRVWSPSELVSLANSRGASFAPGSSWEYSNTNTLLLQMVVEQVTGNSLAQEFQNAFFTPLSMNRTSYPSTRIMPEPFVNGYFTDSTTGSKMETTSLFDPSIASGAGAIISTLEDVRVWTEAIGRGDLLSPESQAERLVMNPAGDGYDAYGLGIARIGDWIGHDGVYPLGYQTAAFYDPLGDQTVVILSNTTWDDDYHFPDAVFARITPLLIPEPSVWALLLLGSGVSLSLRRSKIFTLMLRRPPDDRTTPAGTDGARRVPP